MDRYILLINVCLFNFSINSGDDMNIFEHQLVDKDEDYKVVISPSQVYRFYSEPLQWYKETVLGEVGFRGNEASMIGSICHYVYKEMVEHNGECDKEEMHNKIESDLLEYCSKEQLVIDVPSVLDTYPKVCNCVLSEYIQRHQCECICEKGMYIPLSPSICLAGSCDRYEIEDGIVCDYKTVGSKPNLDRIPINYRLQLMSYASMWKYLGFSPKAIRIIYGVKPTKTIEARCFCVTEEITEAYTNQMIKVYDCICRSIELVEAHPELQDIVFKGVPYEI